MTLQIGVTGGIGAGKSVVCRVFRALGIPVYEADERAKWLIEHDPILKTDVVRVLGPNAYERHHEPTYGRYNRAWVAAQVFADPDLLVRLNAVVHPRVLSDTANWVGQHADKPYVVKEAALMRAAGDGNTLDKIIVVRAPLDLRVARIQARDPHRSEAEIRNIISRQVDDDARLAIADYVIDNDERQLLLPQVVSLHKAFVNFRA